ncbi:MAG: Ig-like domain-containing protein [Gemmatimonadota bacterium]|nr:Ig-like domain-containing protein [Gemmatimonadota bacterium]
MRGARVLSRLAIPALVAIALDACGGAKSTGVTAPPTGAIASITVVPATTSLIVGDTLRLVATAYDAKSNIITTDTVAWASSDSSVATVSDSGTVTGLASGTANISATSHGITASATITVTPPPTKPFTSVTAIAAGFAHTCALGAGGTAYCWGSNTSGQLGNDTTTLSPFPLAVSGGLTFTSLAAGYGHTCGVTGAGVAYCWGDNASGELGATTTASTSGSPVAVSGGLVFRAVSAGYAHTCGVTADGSAYCWGANESGELGNGTVGGNSSAPVLVAGGLTFASVSAGGVFTCGVTTAGAGYCWGSNAYGVLGNGGTSDSDVPVAVAGGLNVASISAGVYHACALTTSGAAYCWGEADNGQLGTGLTSLSSNVPLAVAGGHTFASISAGQLSSCAVSGTGAAYCWGAGSFGDLGDGATGQATTPQLVSGGAAYSAVSTGISFHACALDTSGAAYCWGYDNSGELGTGGAGGFSVTPQQVVVPNH